MFQYQAVQIHVFYPVVKTFSGQRFYNEWMYISACQLCLTLSILLSWWSKDIHICWTICQHSLKTLSGDIVYWVQAYTWLLPSLLDLVYAAHDWDSPGTCQKGQKPSFCWVNGPKCLTQTKSNLSFLFRYYGCF